VSWLAFGVCLWMMPPLQGSVPRASAWGAFAVVDASSTRLLASPGLNAPESLHTAYCEHGHELGVSFVYRRRATDAHTRTGIADHLASQAGTLFRVTRGTAEPDESCFLASDALLSSATPLTLRPPTPEGGCDPESQGQYAAERRRSIVRCWRLAHLPPDSHIVLVEFARRGRDALASLVLASPSAAVFADFPAQYRGEGQDLWRVGDGGVLSPRGFDVLVALRQDGSYALAVSWVGTEGASLMLLVSRDGRTFAREVADNRDWAPKSREDPGRRR
jgi:hypothetical protein